MFRVKSKRTGKVIDQFEKIMTQTDRLIVIPADGEIDHEVIEFSEEIIVEEVNG